MGRKADFDGCGKSRPRRALIPGPSSLYRLHYLGHFNDSVHTNTTILVRERPLSSLLFSVLSTFFAQ